MFTLYYHKTYTVIMYSTRHYYQNLIKLNFVDRFSKNIKSRENPSSGTRVVPRERTNTRTGRQTHMKKMRVAFQNFDVIYLLTAIGLSPGGSTHLYTNNT